MFYEIIVDSDTADFTLLEELRQQLTSACENNIDKEAATLGFTVNSGRIVLRRGVWGLERSEEEDVRQLSAAYPEQTFIFSKTWEVMSSYKLENLENFSRQEYKNGVRTKIFRPQPIQWVEESTTRNWFN